MRLDRTCARRTLVWARRPAASTSTFVTHSVDAVHMGALGADELAQNFFRPKNHSRPDSAASAVRFGSIREPPRALPRITRAVCRCRVASRVSASAARTTPARPRSVASGGDIKKMSCCCRFPAHGGEGGNDKETHKHRVTSAWRQPQANGFYRASVSLGIIFLLLCFGLLGVGLCLVFILDLLLLRVRQLFAHSFVLVLNHGDCRELLESKETQVHIWGIWCKRRPMERHGGMPLWSTEADRERHGGMPLWLTETDRERHGGMPLWLTTAEHHGGMPLWVTAADLGNVIVGCRCG